MIQGYLNFNRYALNNVETLSKKDIIKRFNDRLSAIKELFINKELLDNFLFSKNEYDNLEISNTMLDNQVIGEIKKISDNDIKVITSINLKALNKFISSNDKKKDILFDTMMKKSKVAFDKFVEENDEKKNKIFSHNEEEFLKNIDFSKEFELGLELEFEATLQDNLKKAEKIKKNEEIEKIEIDNFEDLNNDFLEK